MDDKYQALQRDYNQQQDAVRQVKRETVQMLEELKRLARVNEEMHVEKEDAEARIETLTKEAKDWQLKYEKMKIELRSVKGKSQ